MFGSARRRRPSITTERAPDYWMSYSDVMAGLIFAFILLLTLVMTEFRHQERLVEQQQAALALAQEENEAMRQQIAQYLGVRQEIIQRLKLELGDQIQIDEQTGAIVFRNDILFEFNSRTLSQEGKQRLRDFVPRYIGILLSPDFLPYIAQIIVEGHTDSSGTYLYNLKLSQDRAMAVVEYIFSDTFPDFPEREILQKYLTANGRSFSHPRLVNGVEDPDASRRVEFQFRLKDEEAIRRVQELLERGETGW